MNKEIQEKIRSVIEYTHLDSSHINISLQAEKVMNKFPRQLQQEI